MFRGVRMKKFMLVIFIALFVFTGCSKKRFSTYDEISYTDYKELVANHGTFPLVVGSSTCSACSLFKGTMDAFISKYQVDVRFIDISKLSEDDYKSFMSDINFQSTPTTVFFVDGEQTSVYYRIVGAEDFSSVKKVYEKMGYINE